MQQGMMSIEAAFKASAHHSRPCESPHPLNASVPLSLGGSAAATVLSPICAAPHLSAPPLTAAPDAPAMIATAMTARPAPALALAAPAEVAPVPAAHLPAPVAHLPAAAPAPNREGLPGQERYHRLWRSMTTCSLQGECDVVPPASTARFAVATPQGTPALVPTPVAAAPTPQATPVGPVPTEVVARAAPEVPLQVIDHNEEEILALLEGALGAEGQPVAAPERVEPDQTVTSQLLSEPGAAVGMDMALLSDQTETQAPAAETVEPAAPVDASARTATHGADVVMDPASPPEQTGVPDDEGAGKKQRVRCLKCGKVEPRISSDTAEPDACQCTRCAVCHELVDESCTGRPCLALPCMHVPWLAEHMYVICMFYAMLIIVVGPI